MHDAVFVYLYLEREPESLTLLELFMRHPNKVLSREFIAERVWNIDFDTGTNFIDVYVNYLRNKIEKGFKSKLIHTVIGMGYVLKSGSGK